MRVALIVLFLAPIALAEDEWTSSMSDAEFEFASKNPGPDLWWTEAEIHGMSLKLTRGLVNIATGWWEFPKRIAESTKGKGKYPGLRLLTGVFEGAGMAAARTWAGVFEAGTFYSGFPRRYEPILEPKYVFE